MNIILWLGFLFIMCQQKLMVAVYQSIKIAIIEQCYHAYFCIVDNTLNYTAQTENNMQD